MRTRLFSLTCFLFRRLFVIYQNWEKVNIRKHLKSSEIMKVNFCSMIKWVALRGGLAFHRHLWLFSRHSISNISGVKEQPAKSTIDLLGPLLRILFVGAVVWSSRCSFSFASVHFFQPCFLWLVEIKNLAMMFSLAKQKTPVLFLSRSTHFTTASANTVRWNT